MLHQTPQTEERAAKETRPPRRTGLGLSWRVLAFTTIFVMATEVVLYVPSVANFRVSWLEERVSIADAASSAILSADNDELPQEIQDELLNAVGATAIAVRDGVISRLIASDGASMVADGIADLRTMEPLREVADAFATLLARDKQTLRVIGERRDGVLIEMLIDDRELRSAMLQYSVNVLWLSAILSLVIAVLLYFTVTWLLVAPIRRITSNMIAFAEAPHDHDRVIVPSGRTDEIGVAEEHLADMQTELQETLREQRHLADLGLAVSKVNHDLRNMLASAQLFSDRIGSLPDPAVQRFAPKLIGALDRAIAYCQTTLAYGRAREEAPTRRLIRLARLVDDVAEALGLADDENLTWENAVPADLEIDADPDQLFRVLVNLCRNAVQAMIGDAGPAVVRRLTVSAERVDAAVKILVSDTGPGLPERARENLFQAFHGSVKAGGTGLGLPIAAELVSAHGGTIRLADADAPGSTFEIVIPDRRNQPPVNGRPR